MGEAVCVGECDDVADHRCCWAEAGVDERLKEHAGRGADADAAAGVNDGVVGDEGAGRLVDDRHGSGGSDRSRARNAQVSGDDLHLERLVGRYADTAPGVDVGYADRTVGDKRRPVDEGDRRDVQHRHGCVDRDGDGPRSRGTGRDRQEMLRRVCIDGHVAEHCDVGRATDPGQRRFGDDVHVGPDADTSRPAVGEGTGDRDDVGQVGCADRCRLTRHSVDVVGVDGAVRSDVCVCGVGRHVDPSRTGDSDRAATAAGDRQQEDRLALSGVDL